MQEHAALAAPATHRNRFMQDVMMSCFDAQPHPKYDGVPVGSRDLQAVRLTNLGGAVYDAPAL